MTVPHPVRATAKRRKRPHFGSGHVLAKVAKRRCDRLHRYPRMVLLGNVACGPCWEQAIRADERVAVEHELEPVDPAAAELAIDEVAVQRACSGIPVRLTPVEQAEVARRLRVVSR